MTASCPEGTRQDCSRKAGAAYRGEENGGWTTDLNDEEMAEKPGKTFGRGGSEEDALLAQLLDALVDVVDQLAVASHESGNLC